MTKTNFKILSAGLFVLFLLSALFAGAIISDFHAQSGFNIVVLKWTTQNESNIKGFEIERSFDGKSDSFRKIDFMPLKDVQEIKKEYIFEDKTVFKATDRTYYYRLKIVESNDTFSYSKIISVSPTISSARQTWGSIKAMFR